VEICQLRRRRTRFVCRIGSKLVDHKPEWFGEGGGDSGIIDVGERIILSATESQSPPLSRA
jgi:hypothetical protein